MGSGKKSVQDELVQLKIMMLRAMPFYGDVLTRLSIVENSAISTAATDGLRIMYNNNFMNSLKPEEQNFVFMHEVFHVLLMHTVRKKERDPQLWNIAADIIVNDMLRRKLEPTMKELGIPFAAPKNGVYASVQFMESVENIYQMLVEDNAKNKGKKGSGDTGQDGNRDKIIVRDVYSKYGRYKTHEIVPMNDLKPSLRAEQIGDCQPGGNGLAGTYRDASELLDDKTVEKIIKDMIGQISRNGSVGRSAVGSYYVPDIVLDLTKGRTLNWKELLKRYVTQKQSDDSSYATPERKYIHMDLILPGHCDSDEMIEEVWAFVDTSGSVSYDQLQSFLRQLYVIVKDYNCVLNLAYWDTEVTDVYPAINNVKQLEQSMPHHSGGTDINCVYEWLAANHIKPDVMIILTDGYYGVLRNELRSSKLRKNTIQVLNSKLPADDDIKAIGRVTRLDEE